MARLTADARKSLRKALFGLPDERRFPMNDDTHRRLAISGATRSEHAGNISHEEAEHIKAKARRLLARGGS